MQDTQNNKPFGNCETYEFFIRRCHKCKRYQYGANTDIWDKLHSKYFNFIDAINLKNEKNDLKKELDKLKEEYLLTLEEVKKYLDDAYNKLLYRASNLNEKDLIFLNNHQALVKESNEINVIIKIVEMSSEILNNYNL